MSEVDDQDTMEDNAINPALERKQKIASDPLFKQLKSKLVSFMRSVKRALLEQKKSF